MSYWPVVAVGILGVVLLRLAKRSFRRPVVFRDDIPFTPEARSIVESAQSEARQYGQPYVGPEHLLLAIASATPSAIWTELALHGVTPETLRTRLVGELEAQPLPPSASILPFTSLAWRALQEAVAAAAAARQAFTGTRELMIGLLVEDRSRAAAALKDSGVTLALLRPRDALPS